MKKLKEYYIGFKGLKDGIHLFKYAIDKDFFALFKNPLYENGQIEAEIEMNKSEQMLAFNFNLKGTVSSICDKCLEPIEIPIDFQSILYVKFGEEYDEPSEEIVVLPHEEHEFNIGQIIYDLIVTSLPIRHLHEPDEAGNSPCNPDMINKLSEYLVDEKQIDDTTQDNDPRWDKLKKLLDNNK